MSRKMEIETEEEQEQQRFLVYTVDSVLYASPLLSIREVLEYTRPKPVPNLHNDCLGVINMRGEIIPTFSLEKILQNRPESGDRGQKFMMIVETAKGKTACLVDRIEYVVNFTDSDIDRSQVHALLKDNFHGIGRRKADLINIVDIQALLMQCLDGIQSKDKVA